MRPWVTIFLVLAVTLISGCATGSETAESSEAWLSAASRDSDKASTVIFNEEFPADAKLRATLESALDRIYYGPVMSEDGQYFSTRVFEAQSVATPSAEATEATLIVSGVLHETRWNRFGPFPTGTSDHRPTSVAFTGSPGSYRYLHGFELEKYVREKYSDSVERVDVAMALALTKEWRNGPVLGLDTFDGYDAHRHSPTLPGLREVTAKQLEGMTERGVFRDEYVVESASPDGRYQIRLNPNHDDNQHNWWITDTTTGECLSPGGKSSFYSTFTYVKPVWSKSTLVFDVPLTEGPSPSFVHCIIDLETLRIAHAVPVGPLSGQGKQ